MSEEEDCSICCDTFKWPKMLPCQHTFCEPCLCEYLEKFEDKSKINCPLCREGWFIPDKGFVDFPTNYFVSSEKIVKQCQKCLYAMASKLCKSCNRFLCTKCHFNHGTIIKESDDGDKSEDNNRMSISKLKCLVNMKTVMNCKQVSHFAIELPSGQTERKAIRSMAVSYNGGVYVNMADGKNILKYDMKGKIVERIPLMETEDVAAILETRSRFLLVAHFSIKSVLCYTDGRPNFHFTKTPSFYPLGLSELSNNNIVIGGPKHLCNTKCRNDSCQMEKHGGGVVHIVSPKGQLLREISKECWNVFLQFPNYIASSSKFNTFAVCDQMQGMVVVFDNVGNIRASFKGFSEMKILNSLPFTEPFIPITVCSSFNGNYIVGDPNQEFLYVLSPYGEFVGILEGLKNESLGNPSALCTDSDNHIWVGDHKQGSVQVLKLKRFKNIFQRGYLRSHSNESSDSSDISNSTPRLFVIGNDNRIRDTELRAIFIGDGNSNNGLLGNVIFQNDS